MKNNDAKNIGIDQVVEALNFTNPFFLLLDSGGRLIGIGDAYKKIVKGIKELDDFSSHFYWENGLETPKLNKTIGNQVLHTRNHDYNFDVSIRNAPFGVLIRSSMADSSTSIAKIEATKTASLPSENPNPVLRVSSNLKLLYANAAASDQFLADFQIDSDGVRDNDLKINLLNCLKWKTPSLRIFLSRGGKNYMINIIYFINDGHFNIYGNDISLFISQVEEKEKELLLLNKKIEEQRSFYEYILNNLPSDIAVFSPEHKYLFLNIQAIQDDEIRSFMIGKDDFDYCNFKGVSTDLAKVRRGVFNQVMEGGVELEWEDEAKDKDGNRKVVLRKMSPVFNANNQISHVVGYGIDITAIKLSKDILQKNILFQSILMDMATKYINLSVDMVESTINDSLAQLGRFVRVDRVYVFAYDYKSKTASNTYEWCAEGITPQINSLQYIPFSDIPFWIETHTKGEEIVVEDSVSLPESNFKTMLLNQEIKSLITLPLMKGDKCFGFVGFDSVLDFRLFYEDEKNLLRMFGQMLVNVEIQTNYIKQINESTKEIHNINTDLELIVAEKTKRNIELSKSISDQEKLVTIGEIASGIAHDLNTPLGAIKIGAESLRYTISELFNNVVPKCSPEQIHFACERAFLKQGELFVGGLQQRKEIRELDAYLAEMFPELSHETNEVASMMVKSRIELSEISIIKEIIESDNRKDFLALIYNVQLNRNFIETILSSSERAAKVVQDMRSFIKDPKNQRKLPVNLKDNISTVLNIFNYELKRNVDVQLNVPNDLTIIGVDIKLFQLWSNLIKNAIESMDERKDRGELIITAKEKNNSIQVNVQNNGPEIPIEIQKSIFDKFFTTKSERNGSGLGLSIVKNVIEDHNATISVSSIPGSTVFKITFKQTE